MNQETYKLKLEIIEQTFNRDRLKLYEEYAISNARFKVGDIIKDHRWVMRVERIKTYKFGSFPEAVYCGPQLKKDLTPMKNGNVVEIYGDKSADRVKEGTAL